MSEALHIIEQRSLGPLASLVLRHRSHPEGKTMRSILGLVVTVVVIVIVLRFMGVL